MIAGSRKRKSVTFRFRFNFLSPERGLGYREKRWLRGIATKSFEQVA